jgi:hypothetical protein
MDSRISSDMETQKNREKCRILLSLSPKIRYVGIINEFGRTLAGQLRKGVIPLFKVDEARNEFFIEATRNRLRRGFEYSIGKTEYTLTEHEKVKILTLSDNSSFYYFTFDKDTSSQELTRALEGAKRLIMQ